MDQIRIALEGEKYDSCIRILNFDALQQGRGQDDATEPKKLHHQDGLGCPLQRGIQPGAIKRMCNPMKHAQEEADGCAHPMVHELHHFNFFT